MSKTLAVSGSYAVDASNGIIDLTAQTVRISGNLIVTGTRTEIISTDSIISDNIIELNNGETGAGVSQVYAGLKVDRGTLSYAQLRWNEMTLRWEIGVEGDMSEIVTMGAASTFLTRVEDDIDPRLGGNLNVSSYTVTSDINTDITVAPGTNGSLHVVSPLVLHNAAVAAPVDPDTAVVYAGPVAGGGSGVYAATTTTNDELVSRKRAIAYALIF